MCIRDSSLYTTSGTPKRLTKRLNDWTNDSDDISAIKSKYTARTFKHVYMMMNVFWACGEPFTFTHQCLVKSTPTCWKGRNSSTLALVKLVKRGYLNAKLCYLLHMMQSVRTFLMVDLAAVIQ